HRGLPPRPPALTCGHHARRGGRRGGAPRRVTRATTAAEARLIGLVANAVRGPKREGLFALWLVVRSAEALLPPRPVSGKNHRRRLQALDARLASLALPRPLKRALAAARPPPAPARPGSPLSTGSWVGACDVATSWCWAATSGRASPRSPSDWRCARRSRGPAWPSSPERWTRSA